MNDSKASRIPGLLPAPILVATIVLLAILAVQWRTSEAQEGVTYDNLCLEDAYGDRVNCTANDFGITRIEFMDVTQPCRFPGDTAKVRLLLTAAVGSPERTTLRRLDRDHRSRTPATAAPGTLAFLNRLVLFAASECYENRTALKRKRTLILLIDT